MKEIIIPLSKKKIALLFLVSIGLLVLCLWLILTAETQTILESQLLKLVGLVGIAICSLSGIYTFVKFFDKKPGLIINDEGIIDNSSALSAGLIKWKNITNVNITEISGQKFLTIEVNNADEILSKQRGFKKFFMNLNKNYFNSPVHISSNILKCNFQELYDTIKAQISVHHGANTVYDVR